MGFVDNRNVVQLTRAEVRLVEYQLRSTARKLGTTKEGLLRVLGLRSPDNYVGPKRTEQRFKRIAEAVRKAKPSGIGRANGWNETQVEALADLKRHFYRIESNDEGESPFAPQCATDAVEWGLYAVESLDRCEQPRARMYAVPAWEMLWEIVSVRPEKYLLEAIQIGRAVSHIQCNFDADPAEGAKTALQVIKLADRCRVRSAEEARKLAQTYAEAANILRHEGRVWPEVCERISDKALAAVRPYPSRVSKRVPWVTHVSKCDA